MQPDLHGASASGRRDRRPRDAGVVVRFGEDVGLVPPQRLGRVHRGIGVAHERLHPELRAEPAHDPDRDRHRQARVAFDGEALALDERAQLLGQDGPLLDVGLGQDQHEFLAAVAAQQVAGAHVGAQELGDPAQDDVAGGVPVGVVDDLEMVDIDEGDRERSVVAGGSFDLGEQLGEERLAVEDAGQAVDRRPVVRVCQGGRDRVDGRGKTGLETAAAGGDRNGVIPGSDLLGRLDQASKANVDQQVNDRGRQADADRGRGDGGDDRPFALIEPRERD